MVDTLAPSVTIAIDDTNLTVGETATITFTFSEPPTDFGIDDVTADGGSLSNFMVSTDPAVFTVTFTPGADTESATNTIDVGSAYSDSVGNPGIAASSENYVVDTLAPTVLITLDDTALILGETANVTFTFNEPPVDFADDDVTVGNGVLSAVYRDQRSGSVHCDANARLGYAVQHQHDRCRRGLHRFRWQPGHGSQFRKLHRQHRWHLRSPSQLMIRSLIAGETATVTFTFSVPPTGFAIDDATAGNGTLSDFATTADPLVFTATLTPNADDGICHEHDRRQR